METFLCSSSVSDNSSFYLATLSWGVSNDSAHVDVYTLTLIPSSPSTTPSLSLLTNTTTATLTLLRGLTYTVQITANSCAGNASYMYNILGEIVHNLSGHFHETASGSYIYTTFLFSTLPHLFQQQVPVTSV